MYVGNFYQNKSIVSNCQVLTVRIPLILSVSLKSYSLPSECLSWAIHVRCPYTVYSSNQVDWPVNQLHSLTLPKWSQGKIATSVLDLSIMSYYNSIGDNSDTTACRWLILCYFLKKSFIFNFLQCWYNELQYWKDKNKEKQSKENEQTLRKYLKSNFWASTNVQWIKKSNLITIDQSSGEENFASAFKGACAFLGEICLTDFISHFQFCETTPIERDLAACRVGQFCKENVFTF